MHRSVTSILTLAAASSLAAQQFAAPVLPHVPGVSRSSAMIDLDGDGVDEVVARNVDGRSLSVFRNSGHARFTRAPNVPVHVAMTLQDGRSVVGDVDGDGDLDLVLQVSTAAGVAPVLLRNHAGTLVEEPTAMPVVATVNLGGARLLDADGDGDLDLVVLAFNAVVLLQNDGTGAFTLANGVLPPITAPRSLLVGDLDGDGRQDLVLGTLNGWRLWMARGTALVDESASRLPAGSAQVLAITALDHDGDRDLDLVGGISLGATPFQLLANDGTGRFTDASSLLPSGLPTAPISVTALDIDGDGRRDLLLGQQLARNTGGGAFAVIGTMVEQAMQACDVDGDRFDDLLLHSGVARNLGGRGFLPLVHCPATVAADLSGDGSPELLEARYVWRTDGGIVARQQTLSANLNVDSLAAGDLDGDGDLDLANRGNGLGLWTNDGSGALALAFTIPVASTQRGLALLDYDRDGDLDVAVGGYGWPLGAPPGLHQNFGGLNFGDVSATALPAGLPLAFRTVVAGDADADGDADLLYGLDPTALGQPMATLLLNQGNGTFARAAAAFDPPVGTGPAVFAQIDADPELEIAVAAGTALFLFDRSGGVWRDVSAARLPAGITPVTTVVPTDFDGDGDVDFTLGGGLGFLLQNDGTGRFTDATPTHGDLPAAPTMAVDVDGDGDEDLLSPFGLAINQERQLSLLAPLSSGTGVPVEFVARRGFGQGTATGLVGLHVRRLPVAMPLLGGRLFVDPNGAVLLSALASVAGQPAVTSLAVPPDPVLRGVEVHLQGAVLHADGRLALLNHVRSVIE